MGDPLSPYLPARRGHEEEWETRTPGLHCPPDHEQPKSSLRKKHGKKLRCHVSAPGAETGDELRLWETALFLSGAFA